MSREDEQVGCEHSHSHVGDEAHRAFPCAAIQPEGTLEERDHALDTGAKGAELSVDPAAFYHVEHGQPASLGEADVTHPERFGLSEVVLRGEAAIEARLARSMAVERALSFEHRHRPFGIGWVGLHDGTIENESRGAAGEEYLVAVVCLAAILDEWREDLRYRISRVKARLKFMIDDIGP